MEKIIRNFVNYLFDFGLININSVKNFLKIYDIIVLKITNKSELLPCILFEFLASQTEEELRNTCFDLANKFNENQQTSRMKTADHLTSSLTKIFNRFKSDAFYNIKYSKKRLITASSIKRQTPISHLKSDNSKSSDLIEIPSKVEKECTFHPKINNYPRSFNFENDNTFSRLYNDSLRRQQTSDSKKLLREKQDSKIATFTPQINNDTMIRGSNNSLSSKSFFNRIEEYSKINHNKINQIAKENDEKEKEECSFSPKIIAKNSFVSKKPASIRLYEDNTRRLKTQKQKESLYYKSITRSFSSEKNKTINYKKLESLHKDHDNKSKRISKLKQEIDKEQGITFRPQLYTNNNYDVKTSFNDRNNKILENKRNPRFEYETNKGSTITLSPKESHRVEQELISRLYQRDLEKFKERKSTGVNQEPKFDYQSNLRNEIYNFDNDTRIFQKRGLTSVKSKSNLSDNNSNSNRHKNNSNFTFNKPTSGRSIQNNHLNQLLEDDQNFKEFQENRNRIVWKENQKQQIKETSENREQDYADSLRRISEISKGKNDLSIELYEN